MTEYSADRAALETLFPRGRFSRTEDGACVLRANRRARARDELYVYSRGQKLAVMYIGNGQAYRNRLKGLILDELECQGEGILFLKWDSEVAQRLPWFTKNKPHNPEGVGKFVRHSSRAMSEPLGASGLTAGQGEGVEVPQEVTP